MSTPGINLTIVIGHPLGLAPFVQTVAGVATDQSPIWMTAEAPGAAAPGPVSPPVLS